MADTNEVTIKSGNWPNGYRIIIDGVTVRHVKEASISMKSASLVEFTVTFMAKLSHAPGIDDLALEGIGHGANSSSTSPGDVADGDDKD